MVVIRLARGGAKNVPFIVLLLQTVASLVTAVILSKLAPTILERPKLK